MLLIAAFLAIICTAPAVQDLGIFAAVACGGVFRVSLAVIRAVISVCNDITTVIRVRVDA